MSDGENNTNYSGKLVVLEGLDGSGKSVQFGLLRDYLTQQNYPLVTVDFPDYNGTIFGRLVGRYLDGEFGDVYEVSPYVSSLFYAGDRLENRPKLVRHLTDGKLLLANRYVGSNMAYHSAKLPVPDRPEFIGWLKRLEFGANGLPCPALTIYLNASAATSQKMVAQKNERSYTRSTHDIHERNRHFLEIVAEQYLWLCENEENWLRLDVTDANGDLLPREITHQAILKILTERNII
jgi:dTMP kinase